MKNIVFIALSIFLLFSCASKKDRAFNYYQKHKGELAELCNDEFPFKPTYIPGTPVVKTDTIYSNVLIEIPCPDPTPENPKPSVKCPPEKTIIKEIKVTDTIEVESTRKTRALEYQIENLQKELKDCKQELTASNSANKRLWNWLIAFLVITGLFTLFKLSKFSK